MSIAAISWAKKQITGSPAMKAVLVAIADCAGADGYVQVSLPHLMNEVDGTEEQVLDAIEDLHSIGLLAFDVVISSDDIISIKLSYEPEPLPKNNKARKNIKPGLKKYILKRDHYTCMYCGDTAGPFHIDHVTPVSKGGDDTEGNLVCACARCNLDKRDKTPEEWRPSCQ